MGQVMKAEGALGASEISTIDDAIRSILPWFSTYDELLVSHTHTTYKGSSDSRSRLRQSTAITG